MTYYKYRNSSFVVQSGKTTLSLAIIFSLVFMSVAYLAQINKIVAKNFELRAMQKTLKEKQEKNQEMTVLLMGSKSLNNLEGVAKNLNLVSVEKIEYLKIPTGVFVLSELP